MKFLFTCFISLIAFTAMAQTTFVTQVQTLDKYGFSIYRKSARLTDGTILAAGECIISLGDDNEGGALLLTKMDNAGRVVASKSVYNSSVYDYDVKCLTATTDGGFVMIWDANPFTYVSKYDANMAMEWQKQFAVGDFLTLELAKVCQTKDGNYLLSGGISDNLSATSSAILMTLSKTGDVSSTQYFLHRGFVNDYSTNRFVISDVAETKDGNYALLATQGYNNNFHEKDSTILFTVKPDGTTQWATYIKGGESGATGQALLYTSDGAFVITGATAYAYSIDGQTDYNYQTFIAKLTGNGQLAWSRNLASADLAGSWCNGIQEDAKGNYVAVGFGGMNDTEDQEGVSFNLFVGVTPDGDLEWTRKVDVPNGGKRPNLFSLTMTSDGGYVSGGFDPTDEEVGRGGGQIASVHKYDSAFAPCGDAVVDSIGELIEEGSAEEMTMAPDAYTYKMDISEGEKMTISDAGTFLYPCNSVLPVQLLSFTAAAKGNVVNVAWTTAHEINTDAFVVERSGNGSVFVPLQKVVAKGNASGAGVYNIADENPLPNTSYYRLKQVDKDGSFVYSSVASVTRLGANRIVVAPNPVVDVMHVLIQSEQAGKAMVQVADVTGKTLVLKNVVLVAGINTIDVPAAGLSKGLYFVKIVQGSATQTIKVVKE